MKRRSAPGWLEAVVLLAMLFATMPVPGIAGQAATTAKLTSANSQNDLPASTAIQTNSSRSAIPCRAIRNLRELGPKLSFFTNTRTGDVLEYTVIGDAARSNDVLVMFPGTGQTLPDWPLQMLTNAKYSPLIRTTLAYMQSQDGSVSLCHSYRILLFDLPGVGKSPLQANVTSNQIANDIDAMLDDAARTYAIPTAQVDLIGWSLGTLDALKYALLAPKANPSRTVRNLALIAAKPGGNTEGFFDGNEAQCVSTILGALKSAPNDDRLFKDRLEKDAFELTFPYRNQKPYDGIDSGCTATIDGKNREIKLNVETTCALHEACRKSVVEQVLNQKTWPWSLSKGISSQLYVQQRELAFDYSLCYCATAGSDFQTSDCHCSLPAEMSESNGALCQTTSKPRNKPVSSHCAHLNISGTITVINGPEDLFIQYVYGKALVEAYQKELGANNARLVTFPGADGAGHGVLLQHPKWTQTQIWNAMNP